MSNRRVLGSFTREKDAFPTTSRCMISENNTKGDAMRISKLYSILLLAVSLAAVVGCGGASVKTEMVTGLVTLDGEPVANAKITFAPNVGSLGAYGNTDETGHYTLTTQGGAPNKGAVVGEYKVAIVKQENVAPTPSLEEVQKASETGEDIYKKYPAEWVDIVPARYTVPVTSGLTASVQSGKNVFDFALTSE